MDRYDGLAIVGLVVLGVGLWMVAPALALVVIGALLIAVGILGSRGKAREAKEEKDA